MVRASTVSSAGAGLLVALSCASVEARQPVGTPDVYLLAQTIQGEIEVVRWYTGRPLEQRPSIPVEGVDIRENFRQAMSLWQKVNQLATELVGGGEAPPNVTLARGADYGPEHVYQVLTGVQARLQEIREGAGTVGVEGIEDFEIDAVRDPAATPSDVFQVIVQSNRQVNRMLVRPLQPGDVYQQVSQATLYASEILAALGDPTPFPGAPAYEPGLTPGHVYGRLLLVFDRLSAAFDVLDLQMLSWRGDAYAVDDSLTPSDVYDVATLLLSELEFLHSRIDGARAPLLVAHPGVRWPSDVYQRAGILTEQATRILARASADPDLLGERP